MKGFRLGAQLNLSFALVLFVPMIVATIFSIVYYSQKIEAEAVNTINSDLVIADIIYSQAVTEMKNLAGAYAQKKTLVVLFGLNLGEKLGLDLAESAKLDDIDMITLVDASYQVLVRSHAPSKINETFDRKGFIDIGLSGTAVSGTEVLTAADLKAEGMPVDENLSPGASSFLSITSIAPVYDRMREKINGVIVLRRLINDSSPIVKEICNNLYVNAALFQETRLIAACSSVELGGDLVQPPIDRLMLTLRENRPIEVANISRGGSISKLSPIQDFNGDPVGVLMVQRGVDTYLQTRNIAIITLLSIFLTGVLLAFLVKSIIVSRIVNPVQRLREGTERIGNGDYQYTLDVSSTDEIGELTAAFNKMAADLRAYDQQLKEYNQQLEARVRERTEELQVANDQLINANTALEETLESLNPGVSRLIGSNRQQLGLVYATELVADICNYTKLNMILGETLMGEFMKRFFRESHKLLAQYRGMFDKTVGDQIVAIFGTPKDDSPESPIHPFDAIACALQIVEAAESINRIMQDAIQDNYTSIAARHQSLSSEDRKSIWIEDLRFQCRVGINTSNPTSDREIDRMRMVMMGAETCVDYTAQGGAVIYAFRLESNGTPGEIHVGENTKRLVEHVYLLEEMPHITLKGLGVQPGYRVIGRRSLFENIYPSTPFYQRYANNLPETLVRLAGSLKVGRIQLREVRKINEFLDISLSYLEHLAGFYNLCVSRALFAHAVGEDLDMDVETLDALIFASLWHNAVFLMKGLDLGESLKTNEISGMLDESMDDRVRRIVDDLRRSRPETREGRLIALCDQFDQRVFDRTYLRSRAKDVVPVKEMISLMKIEERFDEPLIRALEALMITPADDTTTTVKGDREWELAGITIPRDTALLAHAIDKQLNSEQRLDLLRRLKGDG